MLRHSDSRWTIFIAGQAKFPTVESGRNGRFDPAYNQFKDNFGAVD
jgi:hypothetical protein